MKEKHLQEDKYQNGASKPIFQGYEAVIGIETHIQLDTQTKLFCSCSTRFGVEPNHNTCSVCLGLPGSLPVLNQLVVDNAIAMSLAIGATIKNKSIFARKQYFYPDLPKGYQISQYDQPYCEGGLVAISDDRIIEIERIHIEEDAGKSVHGSRESYVDLNRAGTPLLEMVTKPVIFSPKEASEYLRRIRSIVRYLGVSDGNLEEGSFRCDANVSLRSPGTASLGTRTEIKNLNSFRNIEKAIDYEILRQADILDSGEKVHQQTVRYDAALGKTFATRSKEDSEDYRYFSDPDLMPLIITDKRISRVESSMPILPEKAYRTLKEDYELPTEDCRIIASEKEYFFFDRNLVSSSEGAKPKLCANWFITEFLREARERSWNFSNVEISSASFGKLIALIHKGIISGKIGKMVFSEMIRSNKSADEIIKERGLTQVSDTDEISSVIHDLLKRYPDQVNHYRSGKTKMIGFFVGQVMKQSGGKYNPQIVNKILKECLDGEDKSSH